VLILHKFYFESLTFQTKNTTHYKSVKAKFSVCVTVTVVYIIYGILYWRIDVKNVIQPPHTSTWRYNVGGIASLSAAVGDQLYDGAEKRALGAAQYESNSLEAVK